MATGQTTCSPQRPEPPKQRKIELDDIVHFLSSSLSLAKFYGDRLTTQKLRSLQQAIYEKGALSYPSFSVQEVWASLSEEKKNRLRMDFDASRWEKVVFHPLSCTRENASRKDLLKGFGNAIVPMLAAEFIKAYMFNQRI